MCNRHHLMGHEGSKGHYSLTRQDLCEGFKVCGSLLSHRAAWATPAHQHIFRKAREHFCHSRCLWILTLRLSHIRSLEVQKLQTWHLPFLPRSSPVSMGFFLSSYFLKEYQERECPSPLPASPLGPPFYFTFAEE